MNRRLPLDDRGVVVEGVSLVATTGATDELSLAANPLILLTSAIKQKTKGLLIKSRMVREISVTATVNLIARVAKS